MGGARTGAERRGTARVLAAAGRRATDLTPHPEPEPEYGRGVPLSICDPVERAAPAVGRPLVAAARDGPNAPARERRAHGRMAAAPVADDLQRVQPRPPRPARRTAPATSKASR